MRTSAAVFLVFAELLHHIQSIEALSKQQFYGPTPHTKQTILLSSDTGKCVDVPGGDSTNGQPIFIWVSVMLDL
jgi:hypothetical protein